MGDLVAPTGLVTVVLASTGIAFSDHAIQAAAELARSTGNHPVAVVSVARLHGYALGLPNPGLLPTRAEKQEQERIVQAAIRRLKLLGVPADGHVVITRNPGKSIAKIARRRNAQTVIVQQATTSRLRHVLEGDIGRTVRWRVRPATVHIINGPDPPDKAPTNPSAAGMSES